MKIVILGASGLVGWNLWQVARRAGHGLAGSYSQHALPGLVPLRLREGGDAPLTDLLRAERPDAVACCAAWGWADGCQHDPARAFRENRDGPAAAARAAREVGARFLHFSSSYVFDGRDGPYDEQATPNPISIYGEAKLAGEDAVFAATDGDALVVRTMGVYGPEPQQKNFVYQVRRALGAGRAIRVPDDQFGNATAAANLAAGCLRLLETRSTGIWNLAGPDPRLLRADFARLIARTEGLDESLIVPVPTSALGQSAPRPRQGGLLVGKAEAALGWRAAAWGEPEAAFATHLSEPLVLR